MHRPLALQAPAAGTGTPVRAQRNAAICVSPTSISIVVMASKRHARRRKAQPLPRRGRRRLQRVNPKTGSARTTEWRRTSLAKHLEGSVPLNGGAIIGPAAAVCRGPSSITYWIWARGADVGWQCASVHDILPVKIKPNMARPRFAFSRARHNLSPKLSDADDVAYHL